MNDYNRERARLKVLTSTQRKARDFDAGEMLGDAGTYWTGPRAAQVPEGVTDERVLRMYRQMDLDISEGLRRSFTPGENLVKGVLDRMCTNTGGDQPTWVSRGPEGAVRALDRVAEALTATGRLHEAMTRVLRAAVREGRALIWVRVTPAAAAELSRRGGARTLEVHRHLRYDVYTAEQFASYEDDRTGTPVCVVSVVRDGQDLLLRYRVDGELTVLEELTEGGVRVVWRLPLGGRLPCEVIDVTAVTGEGLLRNQQALNVAVTMSVRNNELFGFFERWMHNMESELDADGNPLPSVVGPGGILRTRSATYESTDADGNVVDKPLGEARYSRIEPVSAEPLMAAVGLYRHAAYAEAHQLHFLTGSSEYASAEAKKVSAADFAAFLRPYAAAYRAAYAGVLRVCAELCDPGKLAGAELDVRLTDRVTPASATDRNQYLQEWVAGAISHESYLSLTGNIDPAGEQQTIAAEVARGVLPRAGSSGQVAGAPNQTPAQQEQVQDQAPVSG